MNTGHHTLDDPTRPKDVSVVDSGGETPGPIPNPEAKPARADGTAPGRRWESRLPPTQQLHTNTRHTPTLMVRGGCFRIPATPTAREHHTSASRTLQAPTHSATRTPRRAGQLSPVADNTGTSLRNPRLRIADNAGTCTLHNADSTCHSDRVWPAPVADSAAPRCRQCRHLHTPQCSFVVAAQSPCC